MLSHSVCESNWKILIIEVIEADYRLGSYVEGTQVPDHTQARIAEAPPKYFEPEFGDEFGECWRITGKRLAK